MTRKIKTLYDAANDAVYNAWHPPVAEQSIIDAGHARAAAAIETLSLALIAAGYQEIIDRHVREWRGLAGSQRAWTNAKRGNAEDTIVYTRSTGLTSTQIQRTKTMAARNYNEFERRHDA